MCMGKGWGGGGNAVWVCVGGGGEVRPKRESGMWGRGCREVVRYETKQTNKKTLKILPEKKNPNSEILPGKIYSIKFYLKKVLTPNTASRNYLLKIRPRHISNSKFCLEKFLTRLAIGDIIMMQEYAFDLIVVYSRKMPAK